MKNLCICIRLCTCKIIRAILTQSPRIFTIRIRTSCKVRRKKQLSTRTHKLFAIDSIDCICDCRFRLIAAFICNIAILYITALSRTIPSGMCPPTTHLDGQQTLFRHRHTPPYFGTYQEPLYSQRNSHLLRFNFQEKFFQIFHLCKFRQKGSRTFVNSHKCPASLTDAFCNFYNLIVGDVSHNGMRNAITLPVQGVNLLSIFT